MSTKKLSLRLATHAMIAGLAFSSAGFAAVELATPAVAQVGDVNIDATRDVSLTIHKKLNAQENHAPTGEVDPAVDGENLGGVKFRVTKLNYDLTTADGLAAARAATVENAVVAEPKVSVEKVTADDGQVVFNKADGLTVGAYLVEETETPRASIKKAAPFIVFLPMTNSDGNGWNYNVWAYPKNSETQISKKVSDSDADKVANVGDVIHYDVTADRPAIDKNFKYVDSFVVYDVIPAGLSYAKAVSEKGAEISVTLGGEKLVAGQDYEVLPGTGERVGIKLTKTGLTKLTKAESTAKVVVTFPFLVEKSAEDTAILKPVNKAGMTYSVKNRPEPVDPGQEVPENPTEPTDPVDPLNPDPENPGTETVDPGETWQPVRIKKVAAEEKSKLLADAEFQVYRCTKDGGALGTDSATAKAKLSGDPLTVNNVDTFKTASNGEAVINALRLRKDRTDNDGYCLVETQAPAGYELLPSPYFFRLDADPQSILDLQIENISSKDNGFHLPATGGMGVGLLMALGAAVAGAGVVYARRTSRS